MNYNDEPVSEFTDDKWWFAVLMAPIVLGLGVTLLFVMMGLTIMDAYYWLCERLK